MRLLCIFFCFLFTQAALAQQTVKQQAIETLRKQIITQADWAIRQTPVTVTAAVSSRSQGTIHDFYSEGDYWWPDPANPDGPYIQKDGMTNPDNFVAHRLAMIRFSKIIGALASAYVLTNNPRYVTHAFTHLQAWFVNPATKMNPSLLYAQAITRKVSGRGIGIIDTIHLMEVAQGISKMEKASNVDKKLLADIKNWFAEYLNWLTTHQYGKEEMEAKNNHGTCWVMQVASFAKLTDNQNLLEFCRNRYKTVLLPKQMATDGSFPLEINRTKPYGYSLFNLDAMVMICQILSTEEDNLWEYKAPKGQAISKGIEFLYPYVADKSKWPFKQDVMYWEYWPVAQPFLVFGAAKFQQHKWLQTWKALEHNPSTEEVIRNLPIRNPVIWF
ncbi:alginate lyase family protein [Emticicia sp. BO119]|uniref:alginate lyase family protein n=1 Tax=Emticicia sp. BO119 TaxID=2757768 RepID=UPI0015F08177|nr:alginate lyase family protein [Emticicia sp. BO119]MBA4853032.1 alginate lyase family protein [Emticicia sp. BO119]